MSYKNHHRLCHAIIYTCLNVATYTSKNLTKHAIKYKYLYDNANIQNSYYSFKQIADIFLSSRRETLFSRTLHPYYTLPYTTYTPDIHLYTYHWCMGVGQNNKNARCANTYARIICVHRLPLSVDILANAKRQLIGNTPKDILLFIFT